MGGGAGGESSWWLRSIASCRGGASGSLSLDGWEVSTSLIDIGLGQ